MSNITLFTAILENSRTEQLPVTLYLTSHLITGMVTHVDEYTAELRVKDNNRCIVALSKIEAVTIS